jgi:exopolyphosphatase / guanosine-5'-triphosphate,3'-diphosphate pyrophosphatase
VIPSASSEPVGRRDTVARMRYSVLDLGSTSFQLLVTEASIDGSLTHVLRDRVILNLGAELASAEGRIPPDAAERSLAVVRRFRDIAERAGTTAIFPIATSALRDAINRPELGRALEEAAGSPIRFLDGAEEGRTTFTGIRAGVAPVLEEGPTLAFDLGGGSLEVVVGDRDGVRWAESFPLGAGRLTAELAVDDPLPRSQAKRVRALVNELLGKIADRVADLAPVRCVAAGGTAGAMARMIAADRWNPLPSSLNQFAFSIDRLDELSKNLCACSLSERLEIPGVDSRRADVLPVGSIVLLSAAKLLGATEIVHSEWGLREGVVLGELRLELPSTSGELRSESIDRLCRLWGLDEFHTKRVAEIGLQLFDEMRDVHGLGSHERELFSHAAALHDIGVRISPDKHHKHGAYLVEHAGLRGFSPEEIAIIASLVRFHRGSGPKSSYPPFAALEPGERSACTVLVGIMRIAHALGRAGEHDVFSVDSDRRPSRLRIEISGGRGLVCAVAEAEERSEVLARALDLDVSVVAVPAHVRT